MGPLLPRRKRFNAHLHLASVLRVSLEQRKLDLLPLDTLGNITAHELSEYLGGCVSLTPASSGEGASELRFHSNP
tara:strand:- start:60 stop:284 length:225 start_codon:yes stop_codon:yes gene_type:complete